MRLSPPSSLWGGVVLGIYLLSASIALTGLCVAYLTPWTQAGGLTFLAGVLLGGPLLVWDALNNPDARR